MLALEISKEFETRLMTCRKFEWKLHQAMKSSKHYPLAGKVHIDEFLIGGPEEEKRGRDYVKKRIVVLALEIIDGKKMGRGYAKLIEDASSDELLSFMQEFVDKKAKVVTDEWPEYSPTKKYILYLNKENQLEEKTLKSFICT